MDPKPPIVYVRGFAGGTSGIDKQVDDPFYGFNDGSTHVRVDGDGDPSFYQFEGPLVRLIDDEGYQLFVGGDQHAFLQSHAGGSLPPASIWVYRFYDAAATTFGTKATPFNIEEAAVGLYDFVQLVRAKSGAARVHLVAHSMGGLICRSMIEKVSREGDREPGRDLVDKLFTFGTPHGGISFEQGGGLVDWALETFGPNGSDIFSPPKMYGYLTPGAHWGQEPENPDWRPCTIGEDAFDVDRVFCLIGTDPTDYGIVQKVVGPKSDGLVMIDNAYVRGAHRAFVHRSHSGRYGLVNSEEGYQNLRRFLFGSLKVKVDLDGLSLPTRDDQVWQAELRLSVRGLPIVMHEQLAAHYCPIQLNLEQQQQRDTPDAPVPLTTVFLLDPPQWGFDRLEPPPPRCRYALKVRVYSLETKHGFFSWSNHLEQVADWEDTLIVDIGQVDGQADQGQHVWAMWKSELPGAIEAHDPISDGTLDVTNGIIELALPRGATAIVGKDSRLTFTISREGPVPAR